MSSGLELAAAILSFLGALLYLGGAIGLLRLPDFYTRLHAPTKAATLGVALIALGSTVLHIGREDVVWLEDVLIILFVMLTTPVSSQVLARAALARGVAQSPETTGEGLPVASDAEPSGTFEPPE